MCAEGGQRVGSGCLTWSHTGQPGWGWLAGRHPSFCSQVWPARCVQHGLPSYQYGQGGVACPPDTLKHTVGMSMGMSRSSFGA